MAACVVKFIQYFHLIGSQYWGGVCLEVKGQAGALTGARTGALQSANQKRDVQVSIDTDTFMEFILGYISIISPINESNITTG